jgi:hypothetical protein
MGSKIRFHQTNTYSQLRVGDWIYLEGYKRPRQITKLKDGEVTVKMDKQGTTRTLINYKTFVRSFTSLAEALR